jgi:hypothetical protein
MLDSQHCIERGKQVTVTTTNSSKSVTEIKYKSIPITTSTIITTTGMVGTKTI